MKQVKAFIERASDGSYSVYMDDNDLDYGIIGTGKTATEAVDDFNATYREMRGLYTELGKPFEEIEFVFANDVVSFLRYYSNKLTLAGLQRITGINQGQLSHYINGTSNPSAKTAKKMQDALHAFGAELSNLNFAR